MINSINKNKKKRERRKNMKILEFNEENEFVDKVKNLNKNKKLKYSILTMGCMLNENDSEKISGMIEKMGYTKCDNPKESDLIVFNTCCIRENAEDKLFGNLGELKTYKKETGAIIAIRRLYDARKAYTRKIV